MREDTSTENEPEDNGQSAGAAESTSFERRPSLMKLQFMLKKVSQSPFHTPNKNEGSLGVSSPAAAHVTDNQQLHSGQNGVSGRLARTNPFYVHYLESSSKGHDLEDAGGEASGGDVNTASVPPTPPKWRFHQDLENGIKTTQNGEFSLASNHTQDHLQVSALPQNAAANSVFHNLTPNSSDIFTPHSAQTQSPSSALQPKGSDPFKDEGFSLFHAAKEENLFQHNGEKSLFDASPRSSADPFTSNRQDDLSQAPQPRMTNPFYTATPGGADLFQPDPITSMELFHKADIKPDCPTKDDLFGAPSPKNIDIFSPSFPNTVDPFPSPVTRDLFQDFSSLVDPFSPTPAEKYDPFKEVSNGTADIFQPLPSETNSKTTLSDGASVPADSPHALSGPVEMGLLQSSPDLRSASHPADPSSIKPRDVILTTPQGTKHNILLPTPFTRARNLSISPGQTSPEMTHVSTFKRPPKPLPRTRPPRRVKPPVPEKPPKPEKPPTPASPIEPEPSVPETPPKPALRPLQKPVIRRKPKPPVKNPLDPENYIVFQDILLIGQEKCVEDWPEDSPQLNPDFRPAGSLRLRRESLKMKADSDEDQEGSGSKNKDKKFRKSLLSRRGSKDKSTDDAKEGKSRTLPGRSKSSKEFSLDPQTADESQNGDGVEYKKNPLKAKVSNVLRRASTNSSVLEGKHQESKDDTSKISKKDSFRRWSEGTVLDNSTGEEEEEEEEEGGDAPCKEKTKKKVKIKFVPHRGFAITVEKSNELKGAHGYTPRKGSKDEAHEDVEEVTCQNLQSTSKAAFLDDERAPQTSAGFNGDQSPCGLEDCKPKKPTKMKLLQVGRRSSRDNMLDSTSPDKKKNSFSAEELDEDELSGMEDCKPKKHKHKGLRKFKTANGQSDLTGFSPQIPQQAAAQEGFAEDDDFQTGTGFMSPGEMYDEQEACRPKKPLKLKGLKKLKVKSKSRRQDPGTSPGTTLSEAAKAEWLAAQMDERAIAGLEDEEEDGDTDSLMEWWYTVEQWDEVPSDDEDTLIKEDVSKSFTTLADKVHRGLRVFNKVFTERAEILWQAIIMLHAIADNISDFHQKAKIAGITGGTTTAVGGATAIAGLALAPFTFGFSLILTAVGVGVATAGGITSASAAISDSVNNMHDRKKVEIVLQEYETHLLDIGKILNFVNQGLYKLRGHPFLRSGTQHYSENWEIRRAVQMITLVDKPVMQAVDITDKGISSIQGLFKGMDKYFLKDSRELKKGCKTEVVAEIKMVANMLNNGIVTLNAIREELHDATGNI